MDAGRPEEAVLAYALALEQLPMHAPALLGAARAAKVAGQTEAAKERYSTLAEQWKNADASNANLAEVRSPVL